MKNQSKLLKTGDETTRVNTLIEIMDQNYGGLAKSLSETDAGGIKQVENAIRNLEERIGDKLIPGVLEFKKTFLSVFEDIVDTYDDFITNESVLKAVGFIVDPYGTIRGKTAVDESRKTA